MVEPSVDMGKLFILFRVDLEPTRRCSVLLLLNLRNLLPFPFKKNYVPLNLIKNLKMIKT